MIYVHFSTVPVPCHPFRFCIDKKIVNFHYDIRYFFYIWYKKNSVIFSYFLWKFFLQLVFLMANMLTRALTFAPCSSTIMPTSYRVILQVFRAYSMNKSILCSESPERISIVPVHWSGSKMPTLGPGGHGRLLHFWKQVYN